MWIQSLGKMQNSLSLKQWCTILGRGKIAKLLKYHKYMQRRNFPNKMQNCLDVLRYVQSHSNKKAACQYRTILVTLYSHLLCTVMTDHFRCFNLVTKAPIIFVICFAWLYVCFIIHLSVRLPLHLSVCPHYNRGYHWNDLREIWYLSILQKYVLNIQIPLKLYKNDWALYMKT